MKFAPSRGVPRPRRDGKATERSCAWMRPKVVVEEVMREEQPPLMALSSGT